MTESTGKFWEAIYNENIGRMIGICYRYTANRQLAEDLAHDAFLKAIDKADSFKGEGVFEGWLRRIVVNHVLTYLRDQKRNQRIDEWLHHEHTVVDPDDDDVITASSEHNDFSTQELLAVINALPEHHRLVFNLYVIDNFKHAQIADALGISEGTSKSHLARARKKIKQLLAEKAGQKQGRKKLSILFLFSFNGWQIDRLYAERFNNNYKPLPGFSDAPSASIHPPQGGASWVKVVASSFVGSLMVVSVMYYLYQQEKNQAPVKVALVQSIMTDSLSEEISREAIASGSGENEETNSQKNTPVTATNQKKSVIRNETKKTNRMKTLNSLGLALVVSSGIAFDSAAQSTTVKVTTTTPVEMVVEKNEGAEETSIVQLSVPDDRKKNKQQEGTFYATSLYWSAENHELYFKGKVKVDIGENNFISNGSVNFLGRVELLYIDGNEVKLDDTIKLSPREYRLTQLNSREATKKYGDKGVNGAVEIHEMKD